MTPSLNLDTATERQKRQLIHHLDSVNRASRAAVQESLKAAGAIDQGDAGAAPAMRLVMRNLADELNAIAITSAQRMTEIAAGADNIEPPATIN